MGSLSINGAYSVMTKYILVSSTPVCAIVSTIMRKAINGLCRIFEQLAAVLLTVIYKLVIGNDLSPTIDTLQTLFNTGDADYWDNMLWIFKVTGFAIAILILMLHLYFFGFKVLFEQKDNLLTLLLRFGICCILIFQFTTIGQSILDAGNELSNAIFSGEYSISEGDTDSSLNLVDSAYMEDTDSDSSEGVNGSVDSLGVSKEDIVLLLPTVAAGAASVIALFTIVMLIILFIVFATLCIYAIRLAVETVRRYVTMVAMYMVSPIFGGCFASESTQNITFTYYRSFIVTTFIFVFSKFWLVSSMYLIKTCEMSVQNVVIIIAWMTLGLRLESWMRDLGLNTVNMGGALFDSIAGTAAAVGFMTRGASNTVGGGLKHVGALTGRTGLVRAGNALSGKGSSLAGAQEYMNNSFTGEAGQKIANLKAKSPLGDEKGVKRSAKSLDALMNKGGFKERTAVQQAVNDMSAGRKQQLGNLALGTGGTYEGLNDLLDSDVLEGANLTGYDVQGNGMKFDIMHGEGEEAFKAAEMNISDKAMRVGQDGCTASVPFTTRDGQQKYANFISDMSKLPSSMTPEGGKISANGKLSVAEISNGADLNNFMVDNDSNKKNYTFDRDKNNGMTDVIHRDPSTGKIKVAGQILSDGTIIKGGQQSNRLSQTRKSAQEMFKPGGELYKRFGSVSDGDITVKSGNNFEFRTKNGNGQPCTMSVREVVGKTGTLSKKDTLINANGKTWAYRELPSKGSVKIKEQD